MKCTAKNGIIVVDHGDSITIRDVSFERCRGVALFLASSSAQLESVIVANSTAAETLSGIRKKHASSFLTRFPFFRFPV